MSRELVHYVSKINTIKKKI